MKVPTPVGCRGFESRLPHEPSTQVVVTRRLRLRPRRPRAPQPVRTLPPGGIIDGVKVYFAGPLFTAAERSWNAEVVAALRAAGHEVYLPQETEPGKDAAGIFTSDVGGIDWADDVVAIMDGPDPDSGTAWEVGYAFRKKPIVLVRTDLRTLARPLGGYNPMLTGAATIRLDLPESTTTEVADAIIGALARLESN